MKQVQVKNLKGEIIESIEVKEVPQCFCGKEMYIYKHVDGLRVWRCVDKCMQQLIPQCVCCKGWVYEDLSYPEQFDETIGLSFYYGHPSCMQEKAKEMKRNQ